LATATVTPFDFDSGFLGVTNFEHREQAMRMPIASLVKLLHDRFEEQADVSRYAAQLNELVIEHLPLHADIEAAETLLVSMKDRLTDLDNGLCEFAGYFEALLVRLHGSVEVSHG